MRIHANNYESFFIRHLDGELSVPERQELEYFLEANPDLRLEWEQLQETKLRPETPITFPGKSGLYHHRETPLQSLPGEWESAFIRYHDQELGPEERIRVEEFLSQHPEYRAEFEILLQARFHPGETYRFEPRQSLYRTEKTAAAISITWYRWAAAAVILIVGSIAAFYGDTPPTIQNTPVAAVTAPGEAAKSGNTVPATIPATQKELNTQPQITTTPPQQTLWASTPRRLTKGEKIKSEGWSNKPTLVSVSSKPEVISDERNPEPLHTSTLTEPPVSSEPMASVTETAPVTSLNTPAETGSTPAAPWASYTTATDEAMDKMIKRKIRFRTALRQVSRVIEKTTGEAPAAPEHKRNIKIAFLNFTLEN